MEHSLFEEYIEYNDTDVITTFLLMNAIEVIPSAHGRIAINIRHGGDGIKTHANNHTLMVGVEDATDSGVLMFMIDLIAHITEQVRMYGDEVSDDLLTEYFKRQALVKVNTFRGNNDEH